jgi:predicted ribosomally synthesized peptide with SipW-like signal peptide
VRRALLRGGSGPGPPSRWIPLTAMVAVTAGVAVSSRHRRAQRADAEPVISAAQPLPAEMAPQPWPHPSPARKVGLTALIVALLVSVVGLGTWSAFSATTSNPGNAFAAGTVILADNDSGSTMLALSNAVPGNTDTSCITVSYSGSLPSNVRLYGTTSGTGLDQYLDLVVTRGSGAAGFDNCTGFSADATNYIGAGAGVVYSGTLQGYPDSYAAGLVDPTSGSPESWTNPENHQYRFQVTVQDNNAAQGLNATQTFTWEARNT